MVHTFSFGLGPGLLGAGGLGAGRLGPGGLGPGVLGAGGLGAGGLGAAIPTNNILASAAARNIISNVSRYFSALGRVRYIISRKVVLLQIKKEHYINLRWCRAFTAE